MSIYFYSKSESHRDLSNFSPHGFEADGKWWPTVEHFFQAQKFHDGEYRERIRTAGTPAEAKSLGRSRKIPIRSDWDAVKDEIMYRACALKFRSNAYARDLLLATGEEELIEQAPRDYYWGCGRTGTGQNKLGRILERVRSELRSERDEG